MGAQLPHEAVVFVEVEDRWEEDVDGEADDDEWHQNEVLVDAFGDEVVLLDVQVAVDGSQAVPDDSTAQVDISWNSDNVSMGQ